MHGQRTLLAASLTLPPQPPRVRRSRHRVRRSRPRNAREGAQGRPLAAPPSGSGSGRPGQDGAPAGTTPSITKASTVRPRAPSRCLASYRATQGAQSVLTLVLFAVPDVDPDDLHCGHQSLPVEERHRHQQPRSPRHTTRHQRADHGAGYDNPSSHDHSLRARLRRNEPVARGGAAQPPGGRRRSPSPDGGQRALLCSGAPVRRHIDSPDQPHLRSVGLPATAAGSR